MRSLSTLICAMLVLSMLLGEVATIVGLLCPETAVTKVKPWLQPGYEYPYDPDGVVMTWFIKYVSDGLQGIIIFFVMAKAAYQYSFRLFIIAWIFFGYEVVDLFMLWWNFKTGYAMYWVLNAAIIAGLIVLLRGEKKTAIVKSLS